MIITTHADVTYTSGVSNTYLALLPHSLEYTISHTDDLLLFFIKLLDTDYVAGTVQVWG
jgi:hypothetical protein